MGRRQDQAGPQDEDERRTDESSHAETPLSAAAGSGSAPAWLWLGLRLWLRVRTRLGRRCGGRPGVIPVATSTAQRQRQEEDHHEADPLHEQEQVPVVGGLDLEAPATGRQLEGLQATEGQR